MLASYISLDVHISGVVSVSVIWVSSAMTSSSHPLRLVSRSSNSQEQHEPPHQPPQHSHRATNAPKPQHKPSSNTTRITRNRRTRPLRPRGRGPTARTPPSLARPTGTCRARRHIHPRRVLSSTLVVRPAGGLARAIGLLTLVHAVGGGGGAFVVGDRLRVLGGVGLETVGADAGVGEGGLVGGGSCVNKEFSGILMVWGGGRGMDRARKGWGRVRGTHGCTAILPGLVRGTGELEAEERAGGFLIGAPLS